MTYKIILHPDAAKELAKFDNSVRIPVLKQIKKLAITPILGDELGNKHGFDLTGYRKLYADKKRIRIVYKIIDEKIIVQIIAVGKRDSMKVYKTAFKRIQ
jgi:mRNA interferase RelE/StbE